MIELAESSSSITNPVISLFYLKGEGETGKRGGNARQNISTRKTTGTTDSGSKMRRGPLQVMESVLMGPG